MKKKIIIEEVISQTFEIEFKDGEDEYEKVRSMYMNEDIIVDDAALTQANYMILDENGEETDWNDLHVCG